MPPNRADLELAILDYWKAKGAQLEAALASKSSAEGTSKAVRGGGHFNPIVNLLSEFFLEAGYPLSSMKAGRDDTVLPGHYRPSKAWDLVVVHEGVLVAAIELKALGGPSFGNNYNNRVEEALGNAVDLAQGNREALVGDEPPWLGYFFIMEDLDGSRRSIPRPKEGSFPSDPEWLGRSYQDRFSLTGRRLLNDGLYDAICYVTSSADNPGPGEPSRQLDWAHFSAAIAARLTYLKDLGYP